VTIQQGYSQTENIQKIIIKAQGGGKLGFNEITYLQKAKKITLTAKGKGFAQVDAEINRAVNQDTVFVNIYKEIVAMISEGYNKNVLVDVHLRNHAWARWNWKDEGNFEIEMRIEKRK
jgi:hypothetical protein